MVVQMVIHSVAALVLPHLTGRKCPEMPEIVIAQHADDAVQTIPLIQSGDLLVPVVVLFDLLVDSKHLRRIFPHQALLLQAADQPPLRGYDFLQKSHIVLNRAALSKKRRIALSPHADGDHVLIAAALLQGISPVAKKALPVRAEIPGVSIRRSLSAHLVPLLTRAKAGLMVGEAPDYAVLIGKLHVRRSGTIQRK